MVADQGSHDYSAKFALQREQAIEESGVRDIFTPHKPVSDPEFFSGRQREVQRLLEYINTPGQHALVYGERGVGKSSLAIVSAVLHYMHWKRRADNVAYKFATSSPRSSSLSLFSPKSARPDPKPKIPFLKRCDSGDTFESIVAKPLQAVGADLISTGLTRQKNLGGKGKLKAPIAELDLDKSRQVTETFRRDIKLSPGTVADALGELEGILLIDEADAIRSNDDKHKLAELIKHLSDGGSSLKVLLVGIAETSAELTAAHPSVQRCLKEMLVRRMEEHELRQIVQGGAEKLDLVFEPSVMDAIAHVSSGYPYFTPPSSTQVR